MGLFWTSETERKEKEIREAVNSINMILRRMDTIDDFGTGRSKEQIFDLLVKTGAETPQKQENATL